MAAICLLCPHRDLFIRHRSHQPIIPLVTFVLLITRFQMTKPHIATIGAGGSLRKGNNPSSRAIFQLTWKKDFPMGARLGVEPRLLGNESSVLPLDDPAMW